jgi:probable HAF family extracellular repeat protein
MGGGRRTAVSGSSGRLWFFSVLTSVALSFLVAAVWSFAAEASEGGLTRWRMHDLGVLPGDRVSWPVGINELGQVVVNSNRREEVLFPCHAFVRQDRKVTRLGTLGGSSTCASAINERGQVVGSSSTSRGQEHAFLWQAGRMRDLGTLPGGRISAAVALNERGQVVGWSTTRSGARHGFLWQRGRMLDLGTLGGRNSWAVDVNEGGWVVGAADVQRPSGGAPSACIDPDPGPLWHAFLWRKGTMLDLGTLPSLPRSTAIRVTDGGRVIGEANWQSGGNRHSQSGFVWQDGTMTALSAAPGAPCVSGLLPADANERGEIVGGFDFPGIWRDGRLVQLDFLGRATAINERGQVVGTRDSQATGEDRAFVWENGRLGNLGGANSQARAINDRGEIAGQSGSHAVLWTPTR